MKRFIRNNWKALTVITVGILVIVAVTMPDICESGYCCWRKIGGRMYCHPAFC